MAEYISREALLKRLDMASDCKNCPRCVDMKTYYDRCAYTDIQDVCSAISDMPVADVQPIRHGRWTWDSNAPYREHGAYKCSNCGCHSDFKENYCYNCGARMGLGDING